MPKSWNPNEEHLTRWRRNLHEVPDHIPLEQVDRYIAVKWEGARIYKNAHRKNNEMAKKSSKRKPFNDTS